MQTILIIDDDTVIGDLEQEVLERAGYAVLRVYSGTEALLLLKGSRPDLILLDLMLPGLSGEEVLPKIQDIPVIVVSAKASVRDKVGLLLGGAVDYLTKPFDTKELLARVMVRLREAPRSPLATVLSCGSLVLNTASHEVCADGAPVQLDPHGIRYFKAADAKSRSSAGKVRAAGSRQRRDAGLYRELPQNPYQQFAWQTASGIQ